jgi:hypothetical protein
MRVVNRLNILREWIDRILDHADLRKENLLIFFDPERNRVRLEAAERNVETYR